jgi:hypothetical protein
VLIARILEEMELCPLQRNRPGHRGIVELPVKLDY